MALEQGQLSELFVAIADWCNARGLKGPGLLEFDGPDGLKCKMNATPERQAAIPPFSCLIESQGWPVGVIDPYGGTVSPINGWSEDRMIAAFKADLAKEGS